jgi:hypothetical protein
VSAPQPGGYKTALIDSLLSDLEGERARVLDLGCPHGGCGFDLVKSVSVLEHVKHRPRAVHRCLRMVRPLGRPGGRAGGLTSGLMTWEGERKPAYHAYRRAR